MSVQYRIAKIDDEKNSVDIDYVYKELESDPEFRQKHTFTCPCCGQPLIAKIGKERKRHFAHHDGEKCDPDGYLHSCAEEVFFEEYTACLAQGKPFKIRVFTERRCVENCLYINDKDCKKRFIEQEIVLTDKYTKISPEKRVKDDNGRYRRPDLLLESKSGEQLWEEIWVTHHDESKRREGNILELKVDSEDDINQFRFHFLKQGNLNDKRVRYSITENCDAFESKSEPFVVPKEKDSSTPRELFSDFSNLPKFRDYIVGNIDRKTEWIDLGLPSGTLWCMYNDVSISALSLYVVGSITFEEAQRRYTGMIPTAEQFIELLKYSRDDYGLARRISRSGVCFEFLLGNFWTCNLLPDDEAVTFERSLRFTPRTSNSPEPSGGFARAKKNALGQLVLVKSKQ